MATDKLDQIAAGITASASESAALVFAMKAHRWRELGKLPSASKAVRSKCEEIAETYDRMGQYFRDLAALARIEAGEIPS